MKSESKQLGWVGLMVAVVIALPFLRDRDPPKTTFEPAKKAAAAVQTEPEKKSLGFHFNPSDDEKMCGPRTASPEPEACIRNSFRRGGFTGHLYLTRASGTDPKAVSNPALRTLAITMLDRSEPAIQSLIEACSQGELLACEYMAVKLASPEGWGGDRDPAALAALAKKKIDSSCAAGDGLACFVGGILRLRFREKSSPGPGATFSRACELGEPAACDMESDFSAIDLGKKESILRRACDLGYSLGCVNYAKILLRIHNEGGAQQVLRAVCEFGSGEACNALGEYGSEKLSQAERVKWFKLGCDLGAPRACGNLGRQQEADGQEAEARKNLDIACGVGGEEEFCPGANPPKTSDGS